MLAIGKEANNNLMFGSTDLTLNLCVATYLGLYKEFFLLHNCLPNLATTFPIDLKLNFAASSLAQLPYKV